MVQDFLVDAAAGIDPEELQDWYESLEDIVYRYGSDEAKALLLRLEDFARKRGLSPAIQFQHALRQHYSGGSAARLSRRPGNRTPHQEPDSLERGRYGRTGQ